MSWPYKIFDSLQDSVIVIDSQFGVHYANNAASLLLDISAKRFKGGKPLDQFLSFVQPLFAEGESLPASEQSPYKELDFTSPTGKTGSVQVTVQPQPTLDGSEGSTDRWIVYMRDVSLERVLAEKYRAELDRRQAVIEDLRVARAQLEDYSKNLEKMVEARTAELSEANQLMTAILNSLGQGILVFDKNGNCLPFKSKVCTEVLEADLTVQKVTDVLKLNGSEKQSFDQWLDALFSEMIPFEDLCGLGPSQYHHSRGHFIALNFNPMRDASGTLKGVVMVATDRTAEVEAKKEAERERSYAKMVVQTVKYRSQFKSFIADAESLIESLLAEFVTQAKKAVSNERYEEIARDLHTVKGGAATFGMNDIASLAHHAETLLGEFKTDSSKSQDLSSSINLLSFGFKSFLEQNSDLIGRSSIKQGRTAEIPVQELQKWFAQAAPLDQELAREIYEDGICVPLADGLAHYVSVVAETASALGKKVEPLVIDDGGVRVDQERYKEFFPTLVHAFRNAVDHAIETPEERLAAGKSQAGKVRVKCERQGDLIRMSIKDDGRGINPDRIRDRLLSMGRNICSLPQDDFDAIQVIFEPSFTSKSEVTQFSGRGVGLSAVKEEVEKLGGRIWVDSKIGVGSEIVIEIPDQKFVQTFKKAA